jgi:hypothetical protein
VLQCVSLMVVIRVIESLNVCRYGLVFVKSLEQVSRAGIDGRESVAGGGDELRPL